MSTCLMLHGIGEPPSHVNEEERLYWISEAMFGQILELARTMPVQLTFDDGNATDTKVALPALVRAGLTASFFIPSGRIGEPGYMSESDILALHAAGMEVGSHGCAHLDWTAVSNAVIANDVASSISRLSCIIRTPVRSVAIPYGYCDRRVLRVLHSLGVGRVYSSFRGPMVDGAWLVRRDCVKAGMTAGDVKTLIASQPSSAEAAITFLRIWRRAGNAAVRRA
jgi:peptidoglycan/xylan/chitin deacetylase (PgdA/CDA1 family)